MLSKFLRKLLTVKVDLKLPEIPFQVEINPIEICTDWMIPFLALGPTTFELHASVFETEVTNPRVHLVFHDSDQNLIKLTVIPKPDFRVIDLCYS
jgi:hypothetical protein